VLHHCPQKHLGDAAPGAAGPGDDEALAGDFALRQALHRERGVDAAERRRRCPLDVVVEAQVVVSVPRGEREREKERA